MATSASPWPFAVRWRSSWARRPSIRWRSYWSRSSFHPSSAWRWVFSRWFGRDDRWIASLPAWRSAPSRFPLWYSRWVGWELPRPPVCFQPEVAPWPARSSFHGRAGCWIMHGICCCRRSSLASRCPLFSSCRPGELFSKSCPRSSSGRRAPGDSAKARYSCATVCVPRWSRSSRSRALLWHGC